MPSTRLLLGLPCVILIVAAACGDTSSGTSGSGASSGSGGSTSSSVTTGTSTGTGTARVPKVHRATATACTADRPPGSIGAGPDGACKTDAECTTGKNGRCVQDLGKPTFCSYDECAADADCGASLCECRNPTAHNANVCVHGNCRLDADCGAGGYCSPSAVTLDPFCTEGVPQGSIGYFCHTAEDECVDDADCMSATAFPSCFFNVEKLHFACFELMCVN